MHARRISVHFLLAPPGVEWPSTRSLSEELKMLKRMLIIGSLAVSAVAHSGSAAATQLFARVGVNAEGPLTSPHSSDVQQDTTTSTPISLTTSLAGASALASADFSVLRLQDEVVGIAGGYNPLALSRARWIDFLTIVPSDAALVGTTGTLFLSFDVDGTFNVVPINPGGPYDGFAGVGIDFSAVVDSSSIPFQYHVLCQTDLVVPCAPTQPQAASTFIFGKPFELYVEVLASANVANGAASASLDYAHTIRWGGFDSILNAQNQPVSGFSVLSDSGFDYAAVPEPATAALVLMGMLTLATQRRSK
jgi:hypothetical protein